MSAPDAQLKALTEAYHQLVRAAEKSPNNFDVVSRAARRFDEASRDVLVHLLEHTVNHALQVGEEADAETLRATAIEVGGLLNSTHLALRHPETALPATLGSWQQDRGHGLKGGYRLLVAGSKGENWHPDPSSPIRLVPSPPRREGAFEELLRRRNSIAATKDSSSHR